MFAPNGASTSRTDSSRPGSPVLGAGAGAGASSPGSESTGPVRPDSPVLGANAPDATPPRFINGLHPVADSGR
jgi:hypothetical protein